jgi:hypothetical protein
VSATLFTIGTWTDYTAAIVGFVVICYYTLVAKWWRKPEGRLIMSWVLWAFSCLAFIALRLSTFLSQQGGLVVRIVIYGTPIWLFLWLAIRIAKAQAAPLQKGETNPSERVPLSLTEIEPQKRWRRK